MKKAKDSLGRTRKPLVLKEQIVFRCKPAEKKAIQVAAKANGRDMSAEMRARCFGKDGTR